MSSLFDKVHMHCRVYLYCRENGEHRKLEQLIATDSWWSFNYSEFVINERFSFAEEVIATDVDCSYLYAWRVIRGRFKLGEK